MIASVIVDVKAKNVNRPFSYLIPEKLIAVIEKGMRVKVPFGHREVLGYVVDIKEKNTENIALKEISDTLDIVPALTEELLALAYTMSRETSSFLVNCLQVMLPPAIKAKYIKKLVKLKADPSIDHLFGNMQEINYDNLNQDEYSLIKQAINHQLVDIRYEVKDKVQIKYEVYYELKKVAKVRGKKQQEVITYLQSHGKVLKSELVKALKVSNNTLNSLISKAIIAELKYESYRDPYEMPDDVGVIHTLNQDQNHAYKEISRSISNKEETTFLLHGVTGSGKTEVYLHVIEKALSLNKTAIMLVPEIALTPQIVYQFKQRFGNKVAVLHSGLSGGEKYDEWRKIRYNEVKIVVGARSAIFAPIVNIGVIIIDEEHESSYKQDEMPKYHAIEIAKIRKKYHHATLVLGSATPSLESYARAVKKVYKLLELPERATLTKMPHTEIINMTDEFKSGNLSIISKQLHQAIIKRLEKQEQVILLLNRRGYDNFLMCRSCGYTITCQNCDISLTYHKAQQRLKCHYCGYEIRVIKECPKCKGPYLKGFGYGTQKVEETLIKVFPTARILRMDYDTTANKGDHEKIIRAFKDRKADILLGTQMIAKGLDFEAVTLVGVLSADTVLKLPDYKASEKTFQIITQVAGRAGRHKENSDVIIQTYNPSHYAIYLAANYNYKAFFNQEMRIRKLGKYLPYYFMTQIVVTADIFQETLKAANNILSFLKKHLSSECILLGPVVPQIKRINNLYSSQIIIKYKKEPHLEKTLESIIISYQDRSVSVIIDRYPNFLL
jgi:primosomal protein N' (replication factor Y)